MPFTFIIELLYKFKKEIIFAVAAIALIGGAWYYHVSEIENTRKIAFKAGRDSTYAQLERAPAETVQTIKIRWVALPKDTVPGKPETLYVKTNLDSLTLDSLKAYAHYLETPYTSEVHDSNYSVKVKALPTRKSIVFEELKVKCTDTSTSIKKTLVKDFDGHKWALTSTVNGVGQGTVGIAYRWDYLMLGPSYQVVGPSPGDWYRRVQINFNYFLD